MKADGCPEAACALIDQRLEHAGFQGYGYAAPYGGSGACDVDETEQQRRNDAGGDGVPLLVNDPEQNPRKTNSSPTPTIRKNGR